MVSRFLNWLKSWFVAVPKIKFPILPVHDSWVCPCCEHVISTYPPIDRICVACHIQADSMGITPIELFRVSHQAS